MSIRIITGDCRDVLPTLPEVSVQCVVTSPPYFGLRDYGVDGQIGLEPTPDEFIAAMVDVFRLVRRVLRDDGTLWLNLGDSYSTHAAGVVADPMKKSTLAGVRTATESNKTARERTNEQKRAGLPEKNLLMIPARVALALQSDGWWLRSHIIWHKPNPMPESVTDRPTSAHESVFLLTKSARYFYDADAVAERAIHAEQPAGFGGGYGARAESMGRKPSGNEKPEMRGKIRNAETRNLRNVWSIPSQPFSGAHFATFPPALIEPCIKAGSRPGDVILDPFGGAGTTGLVADRLGRNATLIELNPSYVELARSRIRDDQPMFADVTCEAAE